MTHGISTTSPSRSTVLAFAAVMFSTFILAGCGSNAQSTMPFSPSALTGTASVESADSAFAQSQFEALGGRGKGGDAGKGPGKKDDEDADDDGDEADDDANEAEVEGAVVTVSGTCPALTMTIGGKTIVTSASTVFRGGICTAIAAQSRVDVRGALQPSGAILADRVSIKGADDEDADEAEDDEDDKVHGDPAVHRSPLEGTVSSVQGTCPALTFNLKGISVTTAAATVYAPTGSSCAMLRPNVKVVVTGTVVERSLSAATITITRLH